MGTMQIESSTKHSVEVTGRPKPEIYYVFRSVILNCWFWQVWLMADNNKPRNRKNWHLSNFLIPGTIYKYNSNLYGATKLMCLFMLCLFTISEVKMEIFKEYIHFKNHKPRAKWWHTGLSEHVTMCKDSSSNPWSPPVSGKLYCHETEL